MTTRNFFKGFVGAVAAVGICAASYAAVTVDENGVGFVGKGDVQMVFQWNNAQLQACNAATAAGPDDAGCLRFHYSESSEVVTEVSWECANVNNSTIQQREQTTTTTSASGGIAASVARVKNQVTGYNLNGGVTVIDPGTSTKDGPAVNSCPNDNKNPAEHKWFLSVPAGAPVEISNVSVQELTVTDTRTNVTKVLVTN